MQTPVSETVPKKNSNTEIPKEENEGIWEACEKAPSEQLYPFLLTKI